jgi:hypothetical protein
VRHGGEWALLKHNLSAVKKLIANSGHWGGIHAVYNIYNATRICELREFAEEAGVTVLWQNLFQPDYLDPFLHGPGVAKLAAAEIEQFYATGLATPVERSFFDNALNTYHSVTQDQPAILQKFRQHIAEIETQYHPDKLGEFVKLWPELTNV